MTLGVAIIGCGFVGSKRAAAVPACARLVSVYDPDSERASSLATSEVAIAASVDAAIHQPGVDLVIVATPHDALAPVALDALAAGCHVLVEKPGAVTVAQAVAIASTAAARGLCARVGFNHRFHPAILEARHAVTSGQYGEVMFLRARYGHGGRLGYEREWRADATVSGGGELIDQGIHLIDLTRFLAGEATLAFSHLPTTFWSMDVEDNAFVALHCGSRALAWLHASWTEWKNLFSLEIMLERAKLDIAGLGGSYGVESMTLYEMQPEMGPPPAIARTWDGADDSWARELSDVAAAIEGGDTIGASIDDAIAALRIVETAYAQRNV